jgi:hypothetical protein
VVEDDPTSLSDPTRAGDAEADGLARRVVAYIRRHRSDLANAISSSPPLRQDVEDRPPAPT